MKRLIFFFALAMSFCNVAYCTGSIYMNGKLLYYKPANPNVSAYNVVITYPGSSSSNPWPSNFTKPTGNIQINSSFNYGGHTFTVVGIDEHAFDSCTGITSVFIPDANITSIGAHAFKNCSGLNKVTIGLSVTNINIGAFAFCQNIDTVIFNPQNCTSSSSIKTRSVIFGGCVQRIPNGLFSGSDSLQSVTIPNTVTNIGANAFYHCDNLNSVTFSGTTSGTRTIGERAFSWCNISYINTGSSSTVISDYAFSHNPIETIILGPSVSYIGSFAFANTNSPCNLIVVRSSTPIEFFYTAFDGIDTNNVEVRVPCGSLTSYQNDIHIVDNEHFPGSWGSFANITEGPWAYSFTSSQPDKGYVNTQIICSSNQAQITAVPNTGFRFDQWSDGNTDNPRIVFLGTPNPPILQASFSDLEQFIVITEVNDSEYGMVLGGGLYYDGSEAILTAIANEGYIFDHWQSGSTENPIVVSVSSDTIFTAYFRIREQYSINAFVSDSSMGMVSGGGTFYEGETAILTVTPYYGYHFVEWSDQNTENPRNIVVQSNDEFTALLAPNVYNIVTQANNPTYGYVTGGGEYSYGTMVTLIANANNGYHFVRWSDDNTDATRTITVTEDMSFTAYFEPDGTQGIGEVTTNDIKVYAENGRIHVTIDGQIFDEFFVYDIMGRRAAYVTSSEKCPILPAGVYLVKIGNHPARKAVVIR